MGRQEEKRGMGRQGWEEGNIGVGRGSERGGRLLSVRLTSSIAISLFLSDLEITETNYLQLNTI